MAAAAPRKGKPKLPFAARAPRADSGPICQSLPGNSLKRAACASIIIHAKRNAVAVAEIKLREITVQMLFGAMLVDALHAALEDRIVALNRVRADVSPSIFISTMVDRIVAQKVSADLLIPAALIGVDDGF